MYNAGPNNGYDQLTILFVLICSETFTTLCVLVDCRVSLTRLGRCRSCKPLGDMLGFYVIKHAPSAPSAAAAHAGANGRHQRATASSVLNQAQLYESAFLPMDMCEAELQLPAGVLLLVPCTFAPGVKGRFAVSVTAAAAAGLAMEAVQGGLAAAVEQMMRPAQS